MAEARPYYPAPLWPKFDEYVAARRQASSPRISPAQRASALWQEANITRWLGMELFGAEDEPDWFVENGAYEDESYRAGRRGETVRSSPDEPNRPFNPPVSRDELRRVSIDQIQPEKRYHYRYVAADLAWKAAALMPDQQEQTATTLAAGGLWLTDLNEGEAADRFYGAILRRCGKTEIGQKAAKSGRIPDVPHVDP